MLWSRRSGSRRSSCVEMSCHFSCKEVVRCLSRIKDSHFHRHMLPACADFQLPGGGIQSSGDAKSIDTGTHLITGGLAVQVLFFVCFIVVAVHFDKAMARTPSNGAGSAVPWRKHLVTLYVVSVLILIRSVFRMVEYIQGFDGYLLSHEVYLYIFDSVLMFAVMVVLNVVHPSEVTALIRGGNVAKKGWKMEKIPRHHQRVSSDYSGTVIASA